MRIAEGNPSRRPINLADGVNPLVEIPDAPSWLNKEAAKEWKRISAELQLLGLIAQVDRTALALYCQCFGQLCQLEASFAAQQREALRQAKGTDVDPAVAITEPFFGLTPTGFKRESAAFRVMSHLREDCHRYLQSFGMSPSARMRVKASESPQLMLPGLDAANEHQQPGKLSLASFA